MNLLQIALIIAAFCVIFLMSLRRRGLPIIILVGFALRAAVAVYDDQRYVLPWSGADSVRFYRQLLEYANASMYAALANAPAISSAAIYPWVKSWAARFAGTEYLFLVFINVLVGTFSILQTHRLASEFLPSRRALAASWFVCVFPVSVVLSAVFIREAFIAAFVIAAFRQLVLSIKNGKAKHLALGALMIFLASVFHGAMILCLLIFPVSYAGANLICRRRTAPTAASPAKVLTISVLLLGLIIGFGPRLSKVGELSDIPEIVDARAQRESRRQVASNSDYPVFLSRNIYRPDIAAIRYVYFMFAPFPWSGRGVSDLLGACLGAANVYAFWLVFRARKRLTVIPLTLFLGVVLTTLMYSMGVSNVGTAIRHRNKAMPVLICAVLATFPETRRRSVRRVPITALERPSLLPNRSSVPTRAMPSSNFVTH